MSSARWFIGLALMAAVGAGVYLALVAVGVTAWLATFAAILAAASLEPTSYLRRWLARRGAR